MRTLLCCAFLLCAVLLCDLLSVLVHFMAGMELLTGVYLLSYHGAPKHGIFGKITPTPVPSPSGRLVRANERYKLSYHGAPERGIFGKMTLTAVPSNPGQQGTDSWVFDDFDV